MAKLPQQVLTARPGAATTTSAVIFLHSFVNTAATILCNGVTINVSIGDWVAVGTDHPNTATYPRACYKAQKTVTLPSTFGNYPFVVTQGSNVINGTCQNIPGARDDFAVFGRSCMYNAMDATGFYDKIKTYAQTGPLKVAGTFDIGDHGYVDNWKIDDSGAGGTGLKFIKSTWPAFPDGNYYSFEYSLGHMAYLGMLGSDVCSFGRDEYHVWCNYNLDSYPQYDDHEFTQDLRGTGGPYAKAKIAYDDFYGAIQPTLLNVAHGNAWALSIGCLKVVAPDGISQAVAPNIGGSRMGSGQITDILNALNTDEPFKWMTCDFGTRYLDAAAISDTSGAQQPLYTEYPTDYQSMFTYTSASSTTAVLPLSVMANPKTNGQRGIFVLTNHDFHQQICQWHKAPAYSGNLAEGFHMLSHGSDNRCGSPAMGSTLNTAITAGMASGNYYTYGDIEVRYTSATVPTPRPRGLRIEVYGSRTPRELHVVQLDGNGIEVWHGRWLEGLGNEVFPVGWVAPQVSPSSRGSI